jgi:hypothetical protein
MPAWLHPECCLAHYRCVSFVCRAGGACVESVAEKLTGFTPFICSEYAARAFLTICLKTRLIAHFRHHRQGASNWLALSYGQIKGFCFLGFALQSHRATEGFTHGVGSRSTKRVRFHRSRVRRIVAILGYLLAKLLDWARSENLKYIPLKKRPRTACLLRHT